MKALVLSGGGARGAYEAGVIAGLHAAGETFDIVCGTSIGAINGSFVAQDKFDQLDRVWHTIGSRGVITLLPQVQKLRSIVAEIVGAGHDPIFKRAADVMTLIHDLASFGPPSHILALVGALESEPIANILSGNLVLNDLKRTLVVSTTNLTRSTSDTFYHFPDKAAEEKFVHEQTNAYALTEENFIDAVRASASIPGAFSPVCIAVGEKGDSCHYVDGGVANNTPIGQAINAGATDVTVIFMDPDDGQPADQPIANLAQIGMACFSVMQQKILASDLRTAQSVNQTAKAAGSNKRVIKIRTVRPATPMAMTVLQFDNQPLLDAAYQIGLQDAAHNLTIVAE
ncbi:MAG: patatin-like phospholipase family protein [Candidatus Velthaea sp.]